MITLYSIYICNGCGEENSIRPDITEPHCQYCKSGDLAFDGMFFWESFLIKENDGEFKRMGELWTESAGIPVCSFCISRGFESKDPVEEGWLAQEKDAEPFTYHAACNTCKTERNLSTVSRDQLRKDTNGLYKQAEDIAEGHQLMFQAQFENDRLNMSESQFLKEYYDIEDLEDFEEEEY